MRKITSNILKWLQSSILAEYLPMFLIVLVLLFGASSLVDKVPQKMVWYGIPSKISTSGDFRFYPSDERGRLLDEHWFWAVPKDINDTKNIQKIYEILDPQGVYKITGTRDADDCGYYSDLDEVGNSPCVASLTLLDINRVGTTTIEYPVQYAVGGTYNKIIDSIIPILNLPLRYFTDDSIAWGTVNTARDSYDKNTWKFAAIDESYQSFPDIKITLPVSDYSNDIQKLPPIKYTNANYYDVSQQWYEEQVQEYGDLAVQFWTEGDSLTWVRKFDVDSDGKTETIVGLCGRYGNHCPHKILIIKDRKIIFSAMAGVSSFDLKKSDTGNGFYLHWVPGEGKWGSTGLCCPLGYVKTRFVYEDKKFKPIYEQEVLYVKVNNTE